MLRCVRQKNQPIQPLGGAESDKIGGLIVEQHQTNDKASMNDSFIPRFYLHLSLSTEVSAKYYYHHKKHPLALDLPLTHNFSIS